jgi:hypothetical protein
MSEQTQIVRQTVFENPVSVINVQEAERNKRFVKMNNYFKGSMRIQSICIKVYGNSVKEFLFYADR